MDSTAVADAWYRAMRAAGEPATLRRVSSAAADVSATVYVKAIQNTLRTANETSEGNLSAIARRYLVLAEDAASFPLPIKRGDQLIIGDLTMIVETVEDTARRVAGVQMAYDVEVYGG